MVSKHSTLSATKDDMGIGADLVSFEIYKD
jgi:hypothetical protein